MPQRQHLLLLEYRLGSHWARQIPRRGYHLRVNSLLLDSRRCTSPNLLRCLAAVPQVHCALPARARHAGLHGVAPARDAAQLLNMGLCRTRVQLVDPPPLERMVEDVQLHHGCRHRRRADCLHPYYLLCVYAPGDKCATVVGQCQGVRDFGELPNLPFINMFLVMNW